jgi:hypothetical protein
MRLTPADIKTLRAQVERVAKRHSRSRRFKIEIGERHNVEQDRGTSINILAVTDHPDWDDTDLYMTREWDLIRKDIPMTDDGRAILDFYIYEWDGTFRCWGDLVSNAQAELDSKGLLAIHEDTHENLWRRG